MGSSAKGVTFQIVSWLDMLLTRSSRTGVPVGTSRSSVHGMLLRCYKSF